MMAGDDWAKLGYLGLLAAAILFWFFAQNRESLGKLVQQAAVWVLIFVGAIAAVGLWGDIRQTVAPSQAVISDQGRIEVPLSPDGHYHLTLQINDTPVRFVVDTGATNVVLSPRDAERVGLDPQDLAYIGRAETANGTVRTAPVSLKEVVLGPIVDSNLRAWVNEAEMKSSLLGMNYLQRWGRIEIGNGQLVLIR